MPEPLAPLDIWKMLPENQRPDSYEAMSKWFPAPARNPQSTVPPKDSLFGVWDQMMQPSANYSPTPGQSTAQIPVQETEERPVDINTLSPMQQYLMTQLGGSSINKEGQQALQENIDKQKSGLEQLAGMQGALGNAPSQLDLSPLAALTDSLTGSKLLSGYTKPQTPEEKIGGLAKIQNMSQSQRQALTQDLIKLAQGKSSDRTLSTLIRNEQSMRTSAGKLVPSFTGDPVLKTSDTQIAQLDKEIKRIKDIKAAQAKGDKTLPFSMATKHELETGISKVLSGASVNGLGSQDRVTFDPVSGRFADFLGKWQGEQKDINAPEYLNQLEATVNGLKSDLTDIRKQRAGGLLNNYTVAHEGNPYAQKTLSKLKEQYLPVENPVSAQPQSSGGFDQAAAAAELAKRQR